jgi:hypothetical protein
VGRGGAAGPSIVQQASRAPFRGSVSRLHDAYEAMPLPNDPSSFAHSTRLMSTSSDRMPGSMWSSSAILA